MSSNSIVGNIGIPLDTVSTFVIAPIDAEDTSKHVRILPRGEIGELAVGGSQLAKEYLNRPEQTHAAFVASSYGRLYRTGDKAKIHTDGTLECLGRLSEGQVKLRGQRLELGEVEAAVLRTSGCHGAVASVHESILVCFCATDGNVLEDKILSSCERWLPKYMIPGEIVLLEKFPRLPSGKVDRKQMLADLNLRRIDNKNNSGSQSGPSVEQLPDEVRDIISNILDRSSDETSGPSTVGLDSLSAIRLASSLRTHGYNVNATEILKLKTVEALQNAIQNSFTTAIRTINRQHQAPSFLSEWDLIVAENPILSDLKEQVEDIYPCTPLQTAMIAESMQYHETYWNEIELVANAGVASEQIVDGLASLAQRNEILRTGFAMKGSEFVSVLFKEFDHDKIALTNSLEPEQCRQRHEHGSLLSTWKAQISPSTRPEEGSRILFYIHHAVYDGWSFDMLLSDLSDSVQGLSPPTRPPFRHVTEFFISRDDQATDMARKYWADHFHGWNRPSFPKLVDTINETRHTLSSRNVLGVPPSKVVSAAAIIGCSPQVFFQASLAQIWSGIMGTPDVVMGTVTSGRTIPVAGVEAILGPCIASLPLRTDLTKTTETAHLLNHIHASNRMMMDHSALSLSEIQKLAGLGPGESLYDILFVYQESPRSDRKDQNVIKEVRHLDRLETKLVVEVEPRENDYAVQLTFHSGSLTMDLAHHVVLQLEKIVLHMMTSPESSLLRTPNLDNLSSTYNLQPQTLKQDQDLAVMFETVASQSPDAAAVCFASRRQSGEMEFTNTTYNQLNQLSNKIAYFLRAQQVETGDIVAVVMEKSTLLYASILAVVKAGCAYLPLLPSTPTDRIKTILRQAKVKTCITDGTSATALAIVAGVHILDVEHASLSELPTTNLETSSDGSRLAYVIFTSGTTGEPKGVAVTQLNIASNIAHLETIYPKRPSSQSRLLQLCSQAFDVSVFEIFYSWHAGMCLCAGTNDVLFEDLEASIRDLDISHLSLTPTVASLIDPRNVPSVEFLVTAGEPLTQSVLGRWGSKVWQGYGPSETTNICSVKHMTPDSQIEHLGWAFPNTSTVVLLPDSLNVAPVGWVGEFCFGGDQVAHGYLNMPEETARSFISHPESGRLYRSGDMGRMLPDGSLIIMGRIDAQLKLRGQRIEAGEIESVVSSTSMATSAVTVLAKRHGVAVDQLVTFYVPSGVYDSSVDILDVDATTNRLLFTTLQGRLPSYMVPSYLVPVPRIRSTSSGKIDREGLRKWFLALASDYVETMADQLPQNNDEADWSETERSMAQAVSMALDISAALIHRWTPFATLGLDSVTSIRLARQLKEALGIRVPISAILRNPHVVGLAQFVDAQSTEVKPSRTDQSSITEKFIDEIKAIFVADSKVVKQVLPCMPLQEAMLSSDHSGYFNRVILRLQIPAERMKAYWEEMARRHGILRTCFVTTSDVAHPIAQVVLEGWSIPWLEFDVVTPSFEQVIRDHLAALPQPVDSKIPPVSLAEIRYRGSTFLSFICHHSLYDGVAMDNLWGEVEKLANAQPLPPAVPYEPFLKEILVLPENVEEFWRNQLVNHQPASLFRKTTSRSADQVSTTSHLGIPLKSLRDKLQTMGISLLSLCQAAWANTLSIAHDAPDVCFGNVVNGRTVGIEDLDHLVAPCFNTIPVRKDVSSHIHRMDLIKSFHALSSEMLPYQFTPLRFVQKLTGRQGLGLFDTLLLLQQPLREMDDSVWILEEDSSEIDIPVVCEVVPCPGLNSVVVSLQYDMNVVAPDIATTLAAIFKAQVKEMIDAPYAKLTTRQSLDLNLKDGLGTLVARREKPVLTAKETSSEEEWSETEAMIRQVLLELSEVPLSQIRRDTTIFQLGLDSINAVQVAASLRRQGLPTSASDVIECPTCAKLADRLAESWSRAVHKSPVPAYDFVRFQDKVTPELEKKLPKDLQVEAVLPCTPMQSAMMIAFVETGGRDYFNRMTFDIDISIETTQLVKAWSQLQNDHPMLRTALVPVTHKDAAYAMVRFAASLEATPLTVESEAGTSSVDLKQFHDEIKAKYLSKPHLPPWHVLMHHDGGNVRMSLFIHHSLYDADSLRNMLHGLNVILNKEQPVCFPQIEGSVAEIFLDSFSENSEAEAFWKGKAPETVVNPFPVLTPLRETSGVMEVDTIKSSLSFESLKVATLNAGVTVQAVLQATWTRVLSAYIGENSVTFGVSLSARTTEATRDSPLPCLATLPIVAPNQTSNRELLDYMMDFNSKAHKFHAVPLSQVQKWLGHPASPVFDTLISYRKVEVSHAQKQLFELTEDVAAIDYPVSIEVEAVEGGSIRLSVTYKSDVVPKEQAALILQQFDAMMAHIALHPSQTENQVHESRPDVFSVLPPAAPVMEAPVKYLHQFVEQMAVSQPDAIALEFYTSLENDGRRQWTYRELDEMGNRVAHFLAEKSPVGSIVAIHFDKCPEAYFSILGILKAGCSFVALDPTAPRARKEFILRDSKTPCLLSTTLDLDFVGDTEAVQISIDSLGSFPSTSRELGESFDQSNTCYCLYTSGTTGTPKGCEITHENAVQAMMAFQELFRGHWGSDSRWLQFAALHFDVSVLEQYWSWSVGITVVAAPKDLILDDLTGSIHKLGITHIDLTPSLARLTHPDDVPNLCRGVFITGGESLKQEILDVWGPKAVIYNAYGPTEATIGVTMYQRVPINGRPSNIGPQFPNVGSYVFRPGTEIPVLRGGVGELCVSGKLVGKGYLGRPELTEERFPTLKVFGERIYRTGDLVRVLHDGCFEFLGRADDQIKLRGQRLEIGEINHAIRQIPQILDAATIVTTQGSGDKSVLVAFVVSTASRDKQRSLDVLEDPDGLGTKAREACRARLPGYMVPSYFLHVPFIPLSVNNKAEVKELKRLFGQISQAKLIELNTPPVSSQTGVVGEIAKKILATLAEFSSLALEELSMTTNIFDVGVDSISALRLSYLLKERGLKAASPALVLRNPLISDLAQALSRDYESKHQERLVQEAKQLIRACRHRYRALACRQLNVKLGDIEYIAPCSSLQQGILSKSLTSKIEGSYFNTFELRLHPGVSVEKLRAAFEDLVASEAILRTAFLSTSEGYVQVALRRSSSYWMNFQAQDEREASKIIQSWRLEWKAANRDNVTQPLQLLLLENNDTRTLVVNMFHAIYDGISFDCMLRRVAEMMEGLQPQGNPPSFIEALSHGPLWQFDSCQEFWREHLQDWTPSPMPSLASVNKQAATASRVLTMGKLEEVRRAQGVTLQAAVLALWTSVLQQHHTQGLTLGVVVSGRSIELAGVERVVGPLFNTLPFHVRNSQEESWSGRMKKCHDFGTAILPFQHLPLHKIQKWCSGGQALFDSLFTLHYGGDTSAMPWDVVEGEMSPDYPLAIEVHCRENREMVVSLVAQGHVADSEMLESMIDQMEKSMELLVEDPDAVVDVKHQARQDHRHSVLHDADTTGTGKKTITADFVWTDTAAAFREEIAVLAGGDAFDIGEFTTILELGLDSIDVIRLSARLKRRGILLAASQVMQLQDIAAMVAVVDDHTKSSGSVSEASGSAVDIEQLSSKLESTVRQSIADQRDDVEQVLPSTALQESMVAAMIQSDFEWYFNHDAMEIQEGVDAERLKLAWDEVICAHSILRTGFVEVDDGELDMAYCQVVYTNVEPWKEEVQIADLKETKNLIDEATSLARYSQGKRDLLQLRFVSLGDQRFLLVSLAHALYDGWSMGLVLDEVQKSYRGESLRMATPPALYLQKTLEGQTEQSKEFWADYLQGVSPTLIPSRAAETHEQASQDKSVWRAERLSSQTKASILSFCKNERISVQVLCQAAWAAALATQTRQLDVVFGVVMSGRDINGAEDLIFPTMNTVASRCVLHGTVGDFLRYVEEEMRGVRQYQGYPLRKAKASVQTKGMELFNSLFMLQKTAMTTTEESHPPLIVSVDGSSTVDYPVCVEAEVVEDGLVWRAACQSNLMSQEDTERLLSSLDRAMEFFTSSPQSEVVSFGESGVSVSGLDIFTLDEDDEHVDLAKDEDDVAITEENEDTSRVAITIRDILSRVSGVPVADIKPSHTLYHMGLDSISAIKVSILLRKERISLSVRDLVQAQDIRDMVAKAGAVEDMSAGAAASLTRREEDEIAEWSPAAELGVDHLLVEHSLSTSDVEAVLPAIPMQVYMLGAWQNEGGAVFHPEFTHLIRVACEERTVWSAWRAVVDSTPILRTCFISTTSRDLPVLQVVLKSQIVGQPQSLGMMKPMVDLRLTWDEKERGWVVHLKIHHALYDGVSLPAIMQLLARQIEARQGEGAGDGANLGTAVGVNSSLTPWAKHVIRPTLETSKAKRRQFWSTYLGNCPRLPPLERSGGAAGDMAQNGAAEGTRKGYPIERTSHFERSAVSDIQRIRQNATSRGVSVQSLFLAAWARCLVDAGMGYTCSEDGLDHSAATSESPHEDSKRRGVVFGVYLANRTDGTGLRGQEHGEDAPPPSLDLPSVTFPRLSLVPLKVEFAVAGHAASLWDAAGQVQKDLIRVSTADVCDVGLWEVEGWTGWKMESFVNFLSLPEEDDRGKEEGLLSVVRPAQHLDARGEGKEEKSSPLALADGGHGGGTMGDVPVRDVFPVCLVSPFPCFSPSSSSVGCDELATRMLLTDLA